MIMKKKEKGSKEDENTIQVKKKKLNVLFTRAVEDLKLWSR